jgi:hypothetical protein
MCFKEFTMKSCFVAIVAVLSFVSFAVAGDSGEVKSVVVNHGQTAPVAAAPAPVVVAAAPVAACTDCVAAPAPVCTSGRCQTQKLYNVEQENSESCRNRLFGGHVVRKTNRTVYKPVRR